MGGTKRKSEASSDGIYSNKSRSRPSAETKCDPTYGQRSAIPGLDDDTGFEEGDGYTYDEDADAIAYLRSVRQEAFGIPNLLVAPKETSSDDGYNLYHDGVGDFRGRYEDGAYLAAADTVSEDNQNGSGVEEDPNTLYFDSIILRYEQLRARLSQTPPAEVLRNLGPDCPTHVGALNKKLSQGWVRRMQTTNPKPAQVACMPKSSVLRLLRLLTTGTCLKKGSEFDFAMTYWVWSLLAKLPERGELNSEEIGIVRELGKKAVLIGMGLKENQDWRESIQDMEEQFEENLNGEGTSNIDLQDVEEQSEGHSSGEETPVKNKDEIDLGVDDDSEEFPGPIVNVNGTTKHASKLLHSKSCTMDVDEDAEQPVSASSQTLAAEIESAVAAEESEDLTNDELYNNTNDSEDTLNLAAMKAQVLERLKSHNGQSSSKSEEKSLTEPTSTALPSKSNTRATVDMIITVAGEVYGQRDLLEFRREWAHIM